MNDAVVVAAAAAVTMVIKNAARTPAATATAALFVHMRCFDRGRVMFTVVALFCEEYFMRVLVVCHLHDLTSDKPSIVYDAITTTVKRNNRKHKLMSLGASSTGSHIAYPSNIVIPYLSLPPITPSNQGKNTNVKNDSRANFRE